MRVNARRQPSSSSLRRGDGAGSFWDRRRATDEGTVDLDVRLEGSFPAPRGEAQEEAAPGRIGRYELRGVLGRGGMATVYRAFDPERGHEVALKVLRGGLADPRRVARFRREAALARRLEHPAFIRALEGGEEGGHVFYAMEVAEGPTLAQALEGEGWLTPRRAAELVGRLARAIDALHARGIVHRDLKPQNVVVHPSRGPVVLDLGLAKDLDDHAELTAKGEIVGTVAFMAPEQVRGGPVDCRTDVFGLGAILYHLLTGRPPHPGPPAVVLRRILHTDPLPPSRVVPQVPPELDAVCLRALDRDPARRWPTAAALAEALDRALAGPGPGVA